MKAMQGYAFVSAHGSAIYSAEDLRSAVLMMLESMKSLEADYELEQLSRQGCTVSRSACHSAGVIEVKRKAEMLPCRLTGKRSTAAQARILLCLVAVK